jgi:hypothetical protein
MYQNMKNKNYNWISFKGDELLFECSHCQAREGLINEEKAQEQAQTFANKHKDCK